MAPPDRAGVVQIREGGPVAGSADENGMPTRCFRNLSELYLIEGLS
jgi:hypothetical protein